MIKHKLDINYSKTEFIIFSTFQTKCRFLHKLGHTPGYFDQCLTFHDHISVIC